MNPIVVRKFGGSSVDGGEKLGGVAALIAEWVEAREAPATQRRRSRRGAAASADGGRPATLIVVSAMGKLTSELQGIAKKAAGGNLAGALTGLTAIGERHREALATAAGSGGETDWVRQEIANELERVSAELVRIARLGEVGGRDNDAVVSLGELLSSRLLAATLQSRGIPARWIDPRDLIATDDRFGGAVPDRAQIFRQVGQLARPALRRGEVVVTGGYVGRTPGGETTTMGRESSDLTATLLGGALRARAVEIWTDVDGLLTADPRLVAAPRLVPELSYGQAALLARLGAKVIHPDTVAPASAVGTEVHIRNRFRPQAPGTVIAQRESTLPLLAIAARETMLATRDGEVVPISFPLEGPWALATGYRPGSVPLRLTVGRQVVTRCGQQPRVLVSLVGRVGDLDERLEKRMRAALAELDAVPVPGRGVALSHLLTLDEARPAIERLHQAAFEEPAATAAPERVPLEATA